MAWDDVKTNTDTLTADEWNNHVTDQKSRAKVVYGAGAPSTIPEMIGSIYIDTNSGDIYLAKGTSSANDWVLIANKNELDTHINDTSIHFTQADISITKSQVSDFVESDYVHTTNNEDVSGVKRFSNLVAFTQEVSTSSSIDWTQGNKQSITLTANTTLTFTNPLGPCNLILKIVQDSVGGHSVTFPAEVKWEGGTAPDLTSDVGGAIRIVSLYFDGTNYYAQITEPY